MSGDTTDSAMDVEKPSAKGVNPFEFSGGELHDPFVLTLFDKLPTRAILNLSKACRKAKDWTANHRKRHQLLLAVVQGNEDAAKNLIQADPDLLIMAYDAVAVEDYSGRLIKGLTPFQAALCAGDTQMCEMMQEHIDQEELTKQFNEILPDGVEPLLAQQEQDAFDFDEAFAKIKAASDVQCKALLDNPTDESSDLGQAIAKFRKEFDEKSKSEKIFNPQHLVTLYNKYNEQYDILSYDQNVVVCRLIIGYVQRYLPANYAQAFVMGLGNAINKTLDRRLEFHHDKASFYPLVPHSDLGFNWYVYPWVTGVPGGYGERGTCRVWEDARGWAGLVFSRFISVKNNSLTELTKRNWRLASQTVTL